jgi:uncharacterized membrane protein
MCDIWIATIFLSGMKQYKAIVSLYLASATRHDGGRGAAAASFRAGRPAGRLCHRPVRVLFGAWWGMIVRNYPADHFMEFEFFERALPVSDADGVGFFYNLGVWLDKFMFWYYLPTSACR